MDQDEVCVRVCVGEGGSWSSLTMKMTHFHISKLIPGMPNGCVWCSHACARTPVHKTRQVQTRRDIPQALQSEHLSLHIKASSCRESKWERGSVEVWPWQPFPNI
ncbi:hypothetical protein ILYODFUR_017404 [Ilyodon furcidens]|uniref:Uncharacterized protein n=1 Tax=Ilyodon furcidens TaxID=33524 RepID=A0ABV0VFY6_9TELE